MTRLKNGKIIFVQIIINDSRGNIGSRSVYSYANGQVGAKTEFYDYVYGTDADAGWKKLLTSYNGETIDYDEIGNPIVYRGADLLWNGRQLRKYKADNFAETYFYNADGLRVRTKHYIKSGSSYEQTGETRYEYVGSSLAYQVTTNVNGAVEQELYFFYDASGNLSVIRQVTPTKDYHFYVTTNAQGDVLGIYSSTGILLASYEYDAWGNCTVSYDNPTYNIGATNPIRYRGYYYDSETELYYLQSRYYDPEIGRFLNADGYISTDVTDPIAYNMFAYCQNNPVMFSDPSGNFGIVSGLLLLGGAVVGLLCLSGCGRSQPASKPSTSKPTSQSQPATTKPTLTPEQEEAKRAVAATIYGEEHGSTIHSDWQKGQEAVAWTIINRYNHRDYPDDWVSVVSQENQFLGYSATINLPVDSLEQIPWDYANVLAEYIVLGQFDKIDYPDCFTDEHVNIRTDEGQSYSDWGGIVRAGGNVFFCYR